MAIKIQFDTSGNPEQPTFILATRSGKKLGAINTATDFDIRDCLTTESEFSLTVHKTLDGVDCSLWDEITPLRLVWCREWDKWFQIDLDTEESSETVKHITAVSLSEAELSQIYLYDIEINTEDDILREDYQVTVLYNSLNPKASLLNRILEKAPHYSISHVDQTVSNIQRSFSFDSISIYDAMQEIAEEIGCIFIFDSNSDENGNIQRTIKVYDLTSACMNNDCGYYKEHGTRYRGTFSGSCPICGGTDIQTGYGVDTTIFVSSDNLSDNITKTPKTDSVKNCFKLIGGDDLMTATIINCNPNGSQYIWYIADDMMADMSSELREALTNYNALYYACNYERVIPTDSEAYNALVAKYQKYDGSIQTISSEITGFSGLMLALYQAIDFHSFLQTTLMPEVVIAQTTASDQIELLTLSMLSTISLPSMSTGTSQATVESALKLMIRSIIDTTRFTFDINTTSWVNAVSTSGTSYWVGTVTVTNAIDDTDVTTSESLKLLIDDDYENYIVQLIQKKNVSSDSEELSISSLFSKTDIDFTEALKEYSLDCLSSIFDCCQGVLDILIDCGYGEVGAEAYAYLYQPYYSKLQAIAAEIDLRSEEIAVVQSMQDRIIFARDSIMDELNFEQNIGDSLWTELCSYRREDKYENQNYVSDGLSNSELFSNALQFIENAEQELYTASTIQHTISTTLKNLLVIPEFQKIIDYFCVGNWIRVQIDGDIYRLRLISYEIDYNSLQTIQVEFSDVELVHAGTSDLASLMSSMKSISTTYDSVKHQVDVNKKNSQYVEGWITNGLGVTNTNIINSSDDQVQIWDSHGFLFKKKDLITDQYDPTQLKIINSTIAITDDNWASTRTAIGRFFYYDPVTGALKSGYGINGEVIVGELILGSQLGIYAENGSMQFDQNGLMINATADLNGNYTTLLSICKDGNPQLYIDSDGNIVMDNGAKITWGNIDLTDLILSGSNITVEDQDGNTVSLDSGLTYLYTKYTYIENLTTQNLDAVYGRIETLETTSLTANSAVILNLQANKADIDDLAVLDAKIQNLDATYIRTDNLDAVLATVETLEADSAFMKFLEANLVVAGAIDVNTLKAALAQIDELDANSAFIQFLQSNLISTDTLITSLAEINVAQVGGLFAETLASVVSSTSKATIDDAYIQEAIVNKIYVRDLLGGTISTNKFTIASDDGAVVIQDSAQVWKDANGNIRIQAGLDANGNFTFSIFDETGLGVLIDATGIKDGAIADDLVTERMMSDGSVATSTIQDSAITSSKIDWSSFSAYVNEQGSNVIDISEFTVNEGGLSYKLGTILTKVDTLERQTNITVTIESTSVLYDGSEITLSGHVYNYNSEITEEIPASKFSWVRSSDNAVDDTAWNLSHAGVKSIIVSDITDTTTYELNVDYTEWAAAQ